MAKSNQAAEQIQAAAPRPASTAPAAADADLPETGGVQRIPWTWRVVFLVFIVCFSIMVLYEASVLVGKLFR